MKFKLSLFILFCSLISNAQGEANNWYFGNKAGITFNSGTPTALINSEMSADEGCATLSDENGQLLFYTNGITVWNKNHQIMPNGQGLLGHQSSTQSGTIVPLPGSTNLFYVFTLDFQSAPNGFRYSIIDLNLEGGLGNVTSTKNVLVYTPSCEKISVVKHANDIDYWIVTRESFSNKFNTYLLSNSGFNTAPIISNSVHVISQGQDAIGAMKISPSGSKVAVCYSYFPDSKIELLDFNTTTGQLSNSQIITSSDNAAYYGAEFSPNNELLYITEGQGRKLHQYNISTIPIVASEILIFSDGPAAINFPRSLQLGPDGKIYVAMAGGFQLSVINNPNAIGIACGFSLNSIDLNNRVSYSGLPVFNQSYFSPAIQLENTCLGEESQFNLGNNTYTSAIWNFGDGATSTNLNPTHTYNQAGIFNVSVTVQNSNGSGTINRNITISAVPTATQPTNFLICDSNNDGVYNFDLTQKEVEILNGQSATSYSIRYFANQNDYNNNLPIADPTNYSNTNPYQLQTIVAEVRNNDNTNCKATTIFDIQVFKTPIPATNIPSLSRCDDTSVGTNHDGLVLTNLTQNATAILNGENPTEVTISYYQDSNLTQVINNPTAYQNTNLIETIFVKTTNNQNPNCFAISSFTLEVFVLPVVNASTISLKQCDDNNDGFSAFNVTEANQLAVSNTNGLTFSYFENLAEAQNNTNPITNTTSYTNQTVSNDQIIMRIENNNGCFQTVTLNLIVSTTLIPSNFQKIYTECDDAISGSNTDGISTFNFSNATAEIQGLFPVGQLLDITFYNNQADALAEQNAIANTANFSNTNYPNSQDIYVRVDSQLNNECLGLGHHITLTVEPIPIAQPQIFIQCDDDQDGLFAFDTSNLESNLIGNLSNVTISYIDQNNNPVPTPFPNPFLTATQSITATITNNTSQACNYATSINFVVDTVPQVVPLPISWTSICDDELDVLAQNGSVAFDTSSFQGTLVGNQTNVIVNYFDQQNNPLPSPLPNPFISGSQNITVEISNANNTSCKINYTIPLKVIERPIINPIGQELICSNNANFIRIIDAALVNPASSLDYSYEWSLNNSIIPNQTQYTLAINTAGSYEVTVTNSDGCKSTRTIEVTASNTATIDNIEIKDLQANNTISVFVSGLGNYVYSLDNQNFQSENTFTEVVPGFYTVYVKDLNQCGIVSEQISVLGIPSFFTPNGDGANDTWFITGINNQFNTKSIISIFDRYGKLLTQFKAYGSGWDGTSNGQTMPSDDYWYTVQLQDGRTIKGHFALKR